ncbi:MAG TPA: flagellar protein FlhE [Halomonas sp.]|nr:flagellar protein FlhE [Halomonas sp.]
MSRLRRWGVRAARVAGLLALLLPTLALAAGSWVATAPTMRVAMVDRESVSRPLSPPGASAAGEITSVVWRYRLPPGAALRGRLCHPGGCVPLVSPRGNSQGLAGLPANLPLRFHFALAPEHPQAVAVQGLQVIVNYQ